MADTETAVVPAAVRTAALIAGSMLAVALPLALRAGRLPAGIDGQWQWGILDHPLDLASVGPVLVAAPVLVALLCAGYKMARWGGAWSWGAAVLGLTGALAGNLVLQTSPPAPFNLAKWPNVLYWPMISGYHTVARDELAEEGLQQFLARYADFQRSQPEPFHLATHPPGLVMLHYAALRFCDGHPGVVRFVLELEPAQLQTGYQLLKPPPGRAERAALDLVAYLSVACAAAAWLPLWRLAVRLVDRANAWLLACSWWFCPGVAVFAPKSDVLYPFFALLAVTAAVAVGEAAVRSQCGRALVAAAATAGVLWGGMLFSLAYAPVAVAIGLAWVAHAWANQQSRRTLLVAAAVAISVAAALTAAFYLLTGLNLVESWFVAYRRHAEFNVRYPRSYLAWLLINPLELVMAAGAPLATVGLISLPWLLCRGWARRSIALRTLLAVLAVWVLLWLSGKNRGEVARLWLIFAPFLLLAAAPGARMTPARWSGVLAVHAIGALLLVNSVQGFLDPASLAAATKEAEGCPVVLAAQEATERSVNDARTHQTARSAPAVDSVNPQSALPCRRRTPHPRLSGRSAPAPGNRRAG